MKDKHCYKNHNKYGTKVGYDNLIAINDKWYILFID
jgi:hypothetical protein